MNLFKNLIIYDNILLRTKWTFKYNLQFIIALMLYDILALLTDKYSWYDDTLALSSDTYSWYDYIFLNKIIFFLIFLFISWRYSIWLIFNDMIYVGFIGRYSSSYDDRLILLANTSWQFLIICWYFPFSDYFIIYSLIVNIM